MARLGHSGLRELLEWFLAPVANLEAPLPAAASSAPHSASFFHKLLFKTTPPDPLMAALPWLWAVAARTRRPDAVLAELRSLADYPGLAEAWQPGWHLEPQHHTYQSYGAQQPATTHTWQELRVPTEHAGQAPPSPLLLYSQHARLWQEKRYYLWPLQADLPFLLAMLPNNPAPLHWHVLRTACRTTDQHAEGSEVVQQVLRSLLAPGPALGRPPRPCWRWASRTKRRRAGSWPWKCCWRPCQPAGWYPPRSATTWAGCWRRASFCWPASPTC